MGRSKSMATRRQGNSSGISVWSFIGGAALVLVAVGIITQLPDIKRYVKISTM